MINGREEGARLTPSPHVGGSPAAVGDDPRLALTTGG